MYIDLISQRRQKFYCFPLSWDCIAFPELLSYNSIFLWYTKSPFKYLPSQLTCSRPSWSNSLWRFSNFISTISALYIPFCYTQIFEEAFSVCLPSSFFVPTRKASFFGKTSKGRRLLFIHEISMFYISNYSFFLGSSKVFFCYEHLHTGISWGPWWRFLKISRLGLMVSW